MARIWKKLGLFILIILCLFNIINKLTTKISFSDEIRISSDYIQTVENKLDK